MRSVEHGYETVCVCLDVFVGACVYEFSQIVLFACNSIIFILLSISLWVRVFVVVVVEMVALFLFLFCFDFMKSVTDYITNGLVFNGLYAICNHRRERKTTIRHEKLRKSAKKKEMLNQLAFDDRSIYKSFVVSLTLYFV